MATATKQQKLAIRRNCDWNTDIKEEYVQWATQDNSKTSLNDLSFEQAQKIIDQQIGKPVTNTWGSFDKKKKSHLTVLSLLRQAQWTTQHERHGEVADLDRLGNWLQSEKSPVRKPLLEMSDKEVSKIIEALKSITIKRYK